MAHHRRDAGPENNANNNMGGGGFNLNNIDFGQIAQMLNGIDMNQLSSLLGGFNLGGGGGENDDPAPGPRPGGMAPPPGYDRRLALMGALKPMLSAERAELLDMILQIYAITKILKK